MLRIQETHISDTPQPIYPGVDHKVCKTVYNTVVVYNEIFSSIDYQYLTSYTIFIYTRTERCGGVNHMYEYRNIRKVELHAAF